MRHILSLQATCTLLSYSDTLQTNNEQFPRYFLSKGLCEVSEGKTLRMKKSIDLHVVVFVVVVVVVVVVAVSVVAVVESFAAEEYTNINFLMDKRSPF